MKINEINTLISMLDDKLESHKKEHLNYGK